MAEDVTADIYYLKLAVLSYRNTSQTALKTFCQRMSKVSVAKYRRTEVLMSFSWSASR